MKKTKENLDQEAGEHRSYQKPYVEPFLLADGFSILETVSLDGEIKDFTDGDDF